MRHALKIKRTPPDAKGVADAAGVACFRRLPLERQRQRHDFVFVEGFAVGDAAVVHDSRGPDEPRATGHHDAGHDGEHAATDGRGGLQRI